MERNNYNNNNIESNNNGNSASINKENLQKTN